MAQGFGGFDTTYYGPTYTEDIEAIERGMQQGLQIGANIRQARAQSERQQADLAAQKQKDIANQMALDKVDNAVREGLILASDSKSDNLNDARVDFSNMLIGKFNELKIARDDGKITSGDYSKALMVLQAQIPAYKAAEKVMYGGVEQYMDALEAGTLSDSNDPEAIEFWSAMSRGDADVSYKVGDNGKISLDGTWIDSNGKKQPISTELAEMDRLPFISTRPETTVKDQLAADVKTILDTKEGNAMRKFNEKTGQYETNYYPIHDDEGNLTDWFKQFSEESFDGYFSGLGRGDKRKALKEYLMDSVEISDRKALMDQLAGFGGAESYGIDTLNKLLKNKNITEINNFINSNVKVNWLDQTKNAVLNGNKNLIAASNQANQKAQLELRKDIADTRKTEAQALSAQKKLSGGEEKSTPDYINKYAEIFKKPEITKTQGQMGGSFEELQGSINKLTDSDPNEKSKRYRKNLYDAFSIEIKPGKEKGEFEVVGGADFTTIKGLSQSQINNPKFFVKRLLQSDKRISTKDVDKYYQYIMNQLNEDKWSNNLTE